MPEPVNPKLDPRPSQLRLCVNTGDWWAHVDASDDVCLHARCEGEHRTYIAAAWLASDEAVERVAEVLCSACWPDGGRDGFPSKVIAKRLAPAVLTALRGETDASDE